MTAMDAFEQARQHFLAALEAQKAGRLAESEALYRAADALVPGRVSVMTNLAAVLIEQGRLAEGRQWCEKLLAAEPGNVEGLLNLALCCVVDEDLSAAQPLLDRGLAIAPTHAGVLSARGSVLFRQGRTRDALASFRLALRSDPLCTAAEEGLITCLRSGRLPEADYDAEVEALTLRLLSSSRFRPESVAHVLRGRLYARPVLRSLLDRVETSWPQRLALDVSPSPQARPWDDALLVALMETTPVTDVAIERLLVTLRWRLLQQAERAEAVENIDFHSALARQCFINEYVYPCLPEEINEVDKLRSRLEAAIVAGVEIPDAWLAAIGSYYPLHTLGNAADLMTGKPRRAPVDALLTQQIGEPLAEAALRANIEQLTPIDDEISRKVRRQYEENPYPRWTTPALATKRIPLPAWLAARTGRDEAKRIGDETAEVLIAGCGTGRQVVEIASQLAGARLLAVDLSISSLAFGMRKAREFGFTEIRFAQADILRLDLLGRRFDYIDSSGVLHHMGDPGAGLSVLCRLLKDEGAIRLGLYSEAARSAVVAVRERIAESGATADADGIRNIRQQLMELPQGTPERNVVDFADFYSMSECRDLLFHVQEHRYTIPGIARLLDDAGLRFLGFDLEPAALARFRAVYPGRDALTDLDLWHEFEQRNPDFFAAMYQFWACNKGPS
ncbi:MAG: methyltransferase domain-containing protein [Betaproteobacteria bacterium]|nr:methyltransferase domain-containing protein [Betaproteobacteria bacterium]